MKREIKFRAWDGNQMYEPFTLQMGLSMTETALRLKPPGWLFSEKNTYMQFTGLLDKNGKEIYEGDIVQIKTQSGRVENFTVEYGIHRRDMKSGWTVDIPGFSFVNSEKFPTFPIVKNYLNGHDLEIIEVIGNIYENPNLINQGTDAPNEQSKEI